MYSLSGQYDPPKDFGIENPLGPRTHNWKGGPFNEGSLFHGPLYTRPMYRMPWVERPLNGMSSECMLPWKGIAIGAGAGVVVTTVAFLIFGKK